MTEPRETRIMTRVERRCEVDALDGIAHMTRAILRVSRDASLASLERSLMPRSSRRRTIEVPTWLYSELTAEATRQDRTLSDLCLEFLIRGLNRMDQSRGGAPSLADPLPTDGTTSGSPPVPPLPL